MTSFEFILCVRCEVSVKGCYDSCLYAEVFSYSSSFREQGHSFSTGLAYSLTKIYLDILYGIFLCMLYNSINVSVSLPVQYGLDYICDKV